MLEYNYLKCIRIQIQFQEIRRINKKIRSPQNAITIQMIEDLLSKVLASILPAGASPTP